MKHWLPILTLALAPSLASPAAHAVAPLDPVFEGVDVVNKLGQSIDPNIPLVMPDGRQTSLGEFFDGPATSTNEEPRTVLLTMNYFRCESICSVQLNELLKTLVGLGWQPGVERFRIVTISFDPTDTVVVAAGKQESYRTELVRLLAEKRGEKNISEEELHRRAEWVDWTFLVGREKAIRGLADNLGYYFHFDEATNQYAHSPVIYMIASTGVITRYLWGTTVEVSDLKYGLMEASNGVLGSFGDKVLASCFVFHDGRYEFAWDIMRIGASSAGAILVLWLLILWRRDRKKHALAVAAVAPLNVMENRR